MGWFLEPAFIFAWGSVHTLLCVALSVAVKLKL